MCVVSMVMDHYGDRFRPYWPYVPNWPSWPQDTPPQVPFVPAPPTPQEAQGIADMIKQFRDALEAARKVDSLTAQPNCEDPEKAKLVDRVAALEKEIAAMKERERAAT